MRNTCTKHPRAARGYALLVTLVMLTMLSVILGSLARRSADTAITAIDAEDDLRQRWAELSTRQTLLEQAPQRFESQISAWLQAGQDARDVPTTVLRPTGSESFKLSLAGLEVFGRIDDEQAKINLNERLLASPDTAVTPDAVVNGILRPVQASRVRLIRPEFGQSLGLKPIESWGQVLPGFELTELLGIARHDQLTQEPNANAVLSRVTLWGDGRLNIRTASDETIRRRLSGDVEARTIASLLRLRLEEPTLSFAALIENATAEQEDDRGALNAVFTETSQTYSLWLSIRPSRHEAAAGRWSLGVLESLNQEDPPRVKINVYHW